MVFLLNFDFNSIDYFAIKKYFFGIYFVDNQLTTIL